MRKGIHSGENAKYKIIAPIAPITPSEITAIKIMVYNQLSFFKVKTNFFLSLFRNKYSNP